MGLSEAHWPDQGEELFSSNLMFTILAVNALLTTVVVGVISFLYRKRRVEQTEEKTPEHTIIIW